MLPCASPDQYFSGKQIDDGHGDHVADDAYGKSYVFIKSEICDTDGYRAPELDERDHGNEKYAYIFKKRAHIIPPKKAPSIITQ